MSFRLVVNISVHDNEAVDKKNSLVWITAQRLREYTHEENARADAEKVTKLLEDLYKIMSGVD